MKTKSRFISMLIALTMLMTTCASMTSAFAEDVKWTEELTKDGWIKVTQEGGPVLGYSPDTGVTILTDDGFAFKDLNKNGTLDVYEDWRQDAKTRAADLAAQMTNEQIAGLMLHDFDSAAGLDTYSEAFLTAIGNGVRCINQGVCSTLRKTMDYANGVQKMCEEMGLGIPMLNDNLSSKEYLSVWPNNLGLGASFDPELVAKRAEAQSTELRARGARTAESPQIDIVSEPRWSRFNSCFSEDPALAIDMAVAYVNAFQSTYDADGNDLGWGKDSVIAIMKHYPAEGAAESGRESHSWYGAYNVYPGDNMYTLMQPFVACMDLPGETNYSAMIMPSFSVGIDDQGEALGGEHVGSGYSYYKVTELLREELGYEGVVFTDYQIWDGMPWGMEDKTHAERFAAIIYAGCDIISCSKGNYAGMLEGVAHYEKTYGVEATRTRLLQSAERILAMFMTAGMFENVYLDLDASFELLENNPYHEVAYDAQLKSVVMLKNNDNLIKQAAETSEKPTVYIPMIYVSGSISWMGGRSAGKITFPIDINVASQYVNVVTDKVSETLTGPADSKGNPTPSPDDIIRASDEEVAACDYALVLINSPSNIGGGYDPDTESFIPISLQYRPYKADSVFVRQTSLAGREIVVEIEDTYGSQLVKGMENRSYFGKTSNVGNESDLDLVLQTAERCENVIVVVETANPFIASEFEDKIDSLLLTFGTSDAALMDIVTGKVEPSGLLPFQMPANMETVEAQYEDVPRDMEVYVDSTGNAYDFTFGMNWNGVINDARVEKYNVEPAEY